jgi:23S rRNA pseudouridine2605 synthase
LSKGIKLPDGVFKPENVRIEKINDRSCWFQLTLKGGKNRIIRRGFEATGHRVALLVREAIGDLKLGNLKEGFWRHLTKKEINQLLSNAANEAGKIFLTFARK